MYFSKERCDVCGRHVSESKFQSVKVNGKEITISGSCRLLVVKGKMQLSAGLLNIYLSYGLILA